MFLLINRSLRGRGTGIVHTAACCPCPPKEGSRSWGNHRNSKIAFFFRAGEPWFQVEFTFLFIEREWCRCLSLLELGDRYALARGRILMIISFPYRAGVWF